MAVGITERGDAGLHLEEWLEAYSKGKLDFVVAITKAPHILLQHFEELPANLIIHATITGWGGTTMEPGVKPWTEEIEAYKELINIMGKDRVVLRVDPIIPTKEGIDAAEYLINSCCMGRSRISILDLYSHVKARMMGANTPVISDLAPLYAESINLNKKMRKSIIEKFPYSEICGELGFPSTGCVSIKDYRALGLPLPINTNKSKQRPSCSCLSQKKELLFNKAQCKHGCLYCYWK